MNKLKMTFGYEGTDFTRSFTISDVADSLTSGIKSKILAVNASLAGGNSDGLNNFFRSDDYNADENIGAFTGITAAQLESTTITTIPLTDGEEGEGE